jgi:hypothetical protein
MGILISVLLWTIEYSIYYIQTMEKSNKIKKIQLTDYEILITLGTGLLLII